MIRLGDPGHHIIMQSEFGTTLSGVSPLLNGYVPNPNFKT